MAFTHRFYRTTRIGTGSRPDPFRTKFLNFVSPTDDPSTTTHAWSTSLRAVFYIIAFADTTIHTAAAADVDITPLSTELADQTAVDTFMRLNYLTEYRVAVRNQIAGDQIPQRWISAMTSLRDFWHYLSRYYTAVGELDAADLALELFRSTLAKSILDYSAVERTAIEAWRGRNGRPAPGIADDTEDMMHDVILTKPIGRSGPIII